MRHFGALPPGSYMVPGGGMKLDAFGNMSRGQLRQILSYLNAAEYRLGYTANMSDRRRAALARGNQRTGQRGFEYFVAHRSNKRTSHLAPGVYQRTSFGKWGTAIKPVLAFTPPPKYLARYGFYRVAREIFERRMLSELRGEIGKELK